MDHAESQPLSTKTSRSRLQVPSQAQAQSQAQILVVTTANMVTHAHPSLMTSAMDLATADGHGQVMTQPNGTLQMPSADALHGEQPPFSYQNLSLKSSIIIRVDCITSYDFLSNTYLSVYFNLSWLNSTTNLILLSHLFQIFTRPRTTRLLIEISSSISLWKDFEFPSQ